MDFSANLGLAGIILAAGRSSRFGSDKRLAPFGQLTLLTHSISLCHSFCSHLLVVTRPSDRNRKTELLGSWRHDDGVEQFCAPEAEQGMGRSLANGVMRLIEYENARKGRFTGVLVMLADLPHLSPTTIEKVVAAGSVDNIALPCYLWQGEKRLGHPVVFGRRWFDELGTLQGDRGGKTIISANSQAVVEVEVNDAGILQDVDRAEDL
ncbi:MULTISPECIES: nucleotidyltransferase family protein [unclassified Gilvimarinus]|uniref:nucleotidyltransferase family protein n=1 Tax=Gilvimarinus sp. DZF01 TaxID=3461371 RepID=UPI004045E810